MFCKRPPLLRCLIAGLIGVVLLLCTPATGLAAEQWESGSDLASAGLLARDAGYGSRDGSAPVRELQRRLRALGDAPGPIDGLYGPRTEGAVQRFQQAHKLAVDGVTGPLTVGRLFAARGKSRRSPKASQARQNGTLQRKSRAPGHRTESAVERPSAPRAHSEGPDRGAPKSSEGILPGLAVLVAGVAVGLLLVALWRLGRRRREGRRRDLRLDRRRPPTGLNFGMVCAALLAVFVIGAACGALFATRAAPDGRDEGSAPSGAVLANRVTPGTRPEAGVRRPPRHQHAARTARPRPEAPARQPAPETDQSGAGQVAPAGASIQPAAPREDASATATYTVQTGDSLWSIAEEQFPPGGSVADVARQVKRLVELNFEDRIGSSDPNLLVAGEKLRLR